MTEEAPSQPSRNVGLWVGLGCLGALVLSCCIFSYWAQVYGWRFLLSQGDETKIWASRTILAGALMSSRRSCEEGAVSGDALPWFASNVPSKSRNALCTLDEATLRKLAAPETSSTRILRDTDRADTATGLGLDPSLCFEHSTEGLTAVGCFDPNPERGAIPYRIIDLTVSRQ